MKKKKSNILTITTIVMIIVVVGCALFSGYQLYVLEEGILDVCATQQDAYVQLVLEQINLKQNRDDEEIITDILSTLDSSSDKYWTFSKDKAMLYVKDVIETNKYKGLTAITYYASDSAKSFLDSLKLNIVTHRNIVVNHKEYIASGVSFEYNGENYRLCLLTNKTVLLNNNNFLEAKIEFLILVAVMLMTLLVSSMLFARHQLKLDSKIIKYKDEIKTLRKEVGYLNELLTQKEYYDTRYQLWSRDAVNSFVEKLLRRNVSKVVMAKVHFKTHDDRTQFLEKATVLLDKKVLRFEDIDGGILLMFINNDVAQVENGMEMFKTDGVKVLNVEMVDLNKYS